MDYSDAVFGEYHATCTLMTTVVDFEMEIVDARKIYLVYPYQTLQTCSMAVKGPKATNNQPLAWHQSLIVEE